MIKIKLQELNNISPLIIFILFGGNAYADQESFTLTTGVDYSSGDYGQSEETNITYVPLTGKYATGRWSLKATLPWIQISGPGGVSGDSRVITNTGISNKRTTESGQGDIVASATFNALELNASKLYVDLNAKVKLPTASEKRGLGTGKTDYAISTDLYKSFGNLTALATLGRRFLGDPKGVNLSNVWYGTIGGVYKLDGSNNIGITTDLREATTSTGSSLREYTMFYSHKFNDAYKIQTYVVYGDTKSSVDYGAGAMFGINWE